MCVLSVWFISYSLRVTSFIFHIPYLTFHIPYSTCIDHSLTHQFFAVFSVLLFSFLLHQLAKFLSKQLRSYGSGKKETTETMYVLFSLTHSLTHSQTHSLFHSLTHSLTHSLSIATIACAPMLRCRCFHLHFMVLLSVGLWQSSLLEHTWALTCLSFLFSFLFLLQITAIVVRFPLPHQLI